ncbi:hypothetical protein HPB47_005634 [Ixodes persulcatus]|uniref:Uncharacterized protein n=1 Tax=Ixodes persulcatus TaxID=34615 RepID=A0AC60PD77_IXOPE|nr:hypothetical protein HPB47_005634 [Ixodes persulcatus]
MSIDMAEAQASTSTIIKDGYEIPPIDCTAETMSSSSSTIVSSNDELHSDVGDYEVVHGKKRRKTSQSSASHSKENTNLQVGFTVLYMPTDTSKVASLSKFKLTDYLNNVAPGMVSVVRINKARNIVAVDVKKPALKAELLKLTKLCALPVRAFLPSDRTNCYGVLRDIGPDCTEQDIKTRLQSTACITDVKRLGKTSPVVRVSATGATNLATSQLPAQKKPSYVLGVDNATTTSVKSIPAASIVKEITPPTHLNFPRLEDVRSTSASLVTAESTATTTLQLRNHLGDNSYDAIALQEPRMTAGDMRIAGHVVYASKPHSARGFPRAALLVRRKLPQSEVDLNDLCTEGAEFVAVTVEWRRHPLTIVSAYVAPNAAWDTHVLADIRMRAKGDLIVAGDFNAHSKSWGDKQDSSRGRELQATVEALDLRNITSGSQTFIRPGVTGSVIDLTFTTWSLRLSATPQADSWGSDHLPIVIGKPPKFPLRTCQIVDWDHYRTLLGEALEGGFPFNSETLSRVLKEATREVRVPLTRPNPDLEWLKLRARRRRAQRKNSAAVVLPVNYSLRSPWETARKHSLADGDHQSDETIDGDSDERRRFLTVTRREMSLIALAACSRRFHAVCLVAQLTLRLRRTGALIRDDKFAHSDELHKEPHPLRISLHIPGLRTKKNVAVVVARQLTEDHLVTQYDGWTRVYTDDQWTPLEAQQQQRLSSRQPLWVPHPDPVVVAGAFPARIPRGFDRQTAAVLHRLRTGSAFTPAWISRFRLDVDPICQTCEETADAEHLLLQCTDHEEERTNLRDAFSHLGLPSSNLEELLRPRASRATTDKALKSVVSFLRSTELLEIL